MSAYTDFLADPQRREVWLLELSPIRRSGSTATFPLYFCSERYGTKTGDAVSAQQYSSRIVQGLSFSAQVGAISEGPIYGVLPARVGGTIEVAQVNGDLDTGDHFQLNGTPISSLTFGGRAAVVRHGGYSPRLGRELTYAEFKVILNGECDGEPQIGEDSVMFALRSRTSRLDSAIQTRRFTGIKDAAFFNGTSAYVDLTNNSAYNFTSGDFTVEFMLYVDAYPGAGTTLTLVRRGALNVDGWAVEIGDDGTIRLVTNQAGANQVSLSTALGLSRWRRVSAVRDGAAAKIYLDGVDATATAAAHVDPLTTTKKLLFGTNDAVTNFFVGAMTDIKVWNTARTEEQINGMKWRRLDSSEVPAHTDLIGYWRCDDGSGSATLVDSTSTGADGTITAVVLAPSGMGDDELEGSPLPDVWGHVVGWPPLLVDSATQLYVVHSGPMDAFSRVDIGGGAATVLGTAQTSFVTMQLGAATPAGKHDTCITPGWTLLRLGGVPTRPLTIDGTGDASGGTFRESVSDLVRYIICNRGKEPLVDPTDLDTDSFDDLETANPAQVGIAYADERAVADVVGFLLGTVGAVLYDRRVTGLFAVKRVESPSTMTPVLSLTEKDTADGSIRPVELPQATWRYKLRFKRNYCVMSSDQILPAVMGTTREVFLKTEWRTAAASDEATKSRYKDATEVLLDTAFHNRADAVAEAERLLALYGGSPGQAFRALFRQRGVEVDRLDAIYFHYRLFDRFGLPLSRFQTSDTAKFLVFAPEDDVESGGVWLTFWREGI